MQAEGLVHETALSTLAPAGFALGTMDQDNPAAATAGGEPTITSAAPPTSTPARARTIRLTAMGLHSPYE